MDSDRDMAIDLPQVTIQHDFQTVMSDVRDNVILQEDVWLSCYKTGESSLHTKLSIAKDAGDIIMSPAEPACGLEFEKLGSTRYSATYAPLGIQNVVLRAPRQLIDTNIEQKPSKVTAFDISPDGALLATGRDSGQITVQPIASSSQPNESTQTQLSTPHLTTILSLRFFPSSAVLLSSAADFTLSIISATDLTVPRTLKGHTRGVTCTAIVERGRNVLSGARDGTVRLWDVGAGKSIHTMGVETFSPVAAMSIGALEDQWLHLPPDGEKGDRESQLAQGVVEAEIGTSDKVVFCALQNGRFTALDLGTKSPIFTSPPPPNKNSQSEARSKKALNAVAYAQEYHLVATGATDGLLTLYDTRQLATPLYSCRRNTASIEDLTFKLTSTTGISEVSKELLVATEDGLPFCLTVGPEGPIVNEEFVGFDCESITAVRHVGGAVWCAGVDGIVRKY
jgi:proteasomal ATPase-associated factor 1